MPGIPMWAQSTAEREGVIRGLSDRQETPIGLRLHVWVWEDQKPETEANQVRQSFQRFLQAIADGEQVAVGLWPGVSLIGIRETYQVVTLWAAFRIHNDSLHDQQWVVENSLLNTCDTMIYVFDGEQLLETAKFGFLYPYRERQIRHRFYLAPFAIESHGWRDVLMRIRVAGINHSVINHTQLRSQLSYLHPSSFATI